MAHYLVTGATGVVGSAIVPRLAALPDTTIQVLIRPKKGGDLAARFAELLAFWDAHYPEERTASGGFATRVRPVAGEITEPALGLSAADRETLVADCTHVVHCAASVRMNLPLAEARQTALFPVASVIDLGKQCRRLQKVEFVSTVGVGGRWQGPLPERRITETREFHNTYEAAKAEAEDLIHREVDAGFPATIHRPSMVVGDSRSGAVIHFQIFYFICEFLSGMRTFGLYPRLGVATLDIVPNDYVAAAIVAASREPATAGAIFHLCSGPSHAVRLIELRERVREIFRTGGLMGWTPKLDFSRDTFMAVMRGAARLLPERERRAVGTLPIYLDYLAGIQQFGNEISVQRLQALGVAAPDNDRVLARVLEWYVLAKRRRGFS
ncbi:MAG TPA: SDR family oxidoreductase [Gammaproteobacteria bacterium]|nr:SDR family oxidoreductase [Gammaproteobacteria bacterium]